MSAMLSRTAQFWPVPGVPWPCGVGSAESLGLLPGGRVGAMMLNRLAWWWLR